jgi:hypothetical protein
MGVTWVLRYLMIKPTRLPIIIAGKRSSSNYHICWPGIIYVIRFTSRYFHSSAFLPSNTPTPFRPCSTVTVIQEVPYLGRLPAAFSPRRIGFPPTAVNMGSVVDLLVFALKHLFSEHLHFLHNCTTYFRLEFGGWSDGPSASAVREETQPHYHQTNWRIYVCISVRFFFLRIWRVVCCPLERLSACRRVSLVLGLPPWCL